jgi:hypothetical protein
MCKYSAGLLRCLNTDLAVNVVNGAESLPLFLSHSLPSARNCEVRFASQLCYSLAVALNVVLNICRLHFPQVE